MTKRALILGIGGQDASYLADILLEQGVEVHGMYRRSSTDNLSRIRHCRDKLHLHQGDMHDEGSVWRALEAARDDMVDGDTFKIYNEADQDSVNWSFHTPSLNYDITFAAVGRLFELIRWHCPFAKVFQPCSAMMFGNATECPQTETTPFNPQSPYACAKVGAFYLSKFYRDVHGLHITTGILYNHDSPRRSEEYLLNKICRSAVRIKRGLQKELLLGDLDQRVAIASARECMDAVVRLLQLPYASDYVIGSNNSCKIGSIVSYALTGSLANFVDGMILGYEDRVKIDPKFSRPGKQQTLVADHQKLSNAVKGWGTRFVTVLMDEIMADEEAKCALST